MGESEESRWFEALRQLLDRSHLWTPEDVPSSLDAVVAPLGLRARIWLVDHEQVALRALVGPGAEAPDPVSVDGSLPGRAFARVESTPALGGRDGVRRWWVPMVDATDRLGVIEFVVTEDADAEDRELVRHCELLAGLVGHLIASVTTRGDHIDRVRRTRPMSTASELLGSILPPLTSSTDRVAVSAILQPCYEVGGDGFDYALTGTTAQLVILDAVGRGLRAGLACAVALAAIRTTRNAGGRLDEQARAADAALEEQFPDTRFATAVLAELDLHTGRLRFVNAGHPPPLLLRGGKLVRELKAPGRMPLGIADPSAEVAEHFLEPDDRLLLYTDGVTEARTAAGDRFGVGRLVDLAEQHERAGLPAPETLRRLAHAVVDHQSGPPADDATLMLVQWSTPAALNTVPKAGQATREDDARS
ncbi:PP2C family protein-serine/threonine phosphatase [Actinoplanes sp. CA-051413]|uniref:PP2C family protein-serine/threonine phosphatase n=1 Tax=Actinoplanes sp. CA-051413 TaxID=3239899 RepID=UPI003D980C2F